MPTLDFCSARLYHFCVSFRKYGYDCKDSTPLYLVEMDMIRKGGKHLHAQTGQYRGESLFYHYRELMSALWPRDDHHRWSDLILRTYFDNDISIVTGCSDSSKTYTMSKIILCDYWCFPNDTLWLVSTTEGRGSELRIWGVIKDLFNLARELHGTDELVGNPLDYLKTITTDSLDEEKEAARSLRRGCIIIPCKTGGVASGLAPYQGIKAPRLRICGDELAAMNESYNNSFANFYGKEDFKAIMAGNFMETDDPLGVASEPEGGWDSFVDSGKTQAWRSTFYGAAVVALDGRDSPNFDQVMPNGKPKYRYLISQKKLDGVTKTKGQDSWEWWSQCVGKPVRGMDIWRVFSKPFCKQHKASEEVIWKDEERTPSYGVDPAYGGGDRCVGRFCEMGLDANDTQILFFHPPEIIPIKINTGTDPEDQIAAYVRNRLRELKIPPQNCFYDSFGRGTLGFAFSKLFGTNCPIPIDSSARPSKRPVRFDLYVEEPGKPRRLKLCDQHYVKFISELWFSVREAIDAEQIRGLDDETIREGCSRKFTKTDDKIEVEPKDDLKERTGRSPDFMDCTAVCVEGARRLGFKIRRLGEGVIATSMADRYKFFQQDADDRFERHQSRQLTYR